MSDPIVHADPFRLRVQKAISATIADISITGGYKHDLDPSKVFRGRDLFGDNDPLPMVSLLEPPLPIDQLRSPVTSTGSQGEWDLLIQGWVEDDRENPTDPAHVLMADVKRRLVVEKKRTIPNSAGTPNPFGMGQGQRVDGKFVGNCVKELIIGPGVVRPPEVGVSNKAYFWLAITLKIVEDIDRPFL